MVALGMWVLSFAQHPSGLVDYSSREVHLMSYIALVALAIHGHLAHFAY
jgi:hypothetical protein